MIGKNRHPQLTPAARAAFGQGCGVLHHSPPPGSYRHLRYAPSPALAGWVQYFWIESWDWEEGTPQKREVLSHPSVHLVFAPGRSRVLGVQLQRYIREIKGKGRILGAKFRPGAFYPFLGKPVSSIADSSLPLHQLFDGSQEAEEEVLAGADDRGMVEAATRFLEPRLPPADPWVETASGVVERIARDESITRVEDVAARSGLKERALQRLFSRYVGASARWVIKRYRVYGALEQLERGSRLDWAGLAQDLGYFDQAHFINDFKKLVGCTPAAYLKP